MSARDDLINEYGRAETAPLGTLAELRVKLDAYRAEVLAGAKTETVAWLVKKAREQTVWDARVLASKVDRGAVRAFLGTGHYRDAMDEHRAEVLREAADAINALPQDYECDPGRGDAAVLLRLMADAGKDTPGGESTRDADAPDFFQPGRTYISGRTTFRCDTISTHPTTGERRALGWEMQYDRDNEPVALDQRSYELSGWAEATPADTCGRCRHAFDPEDTSFDGLARSGNTPFCRRCVDWCHESTDAFHRCPVCTAGGGDRG
ncbi:hypothetical protein [Streptomyces sp. NRRL S-337]|uniref:hypothetical protein n=1 Tax=Streptomyces sp. NRRL S-337 TaxID=1463900 RepID=UPI0004C797B6|nr:hypothetical protein [Streptomyces sp. NRRL S-337]